MNDAYVFIPALGLASCVGLILGLIYFEWYERHQCQWQIRLQETVQAAIAETLARPKPRKVVKPHRLYTPPKPASPCDCPRCRFAQIRKNAAATPPAPHPAPLTVERDAELAALQSDLIPAYLWPFLRNDQVIPYSQFKSKRGAKKIFPTEGAKRACPHLDCVYRGITDQSIHALIHYGHHGIREDIPDLMCQACKRKITSRIMTALYRLRTPSEKVSLVLSSIVEGMSEEGAARIFNPRRDQPHIQSKSIRRWIARAATHSNALHAILFNNLSIPVVQLDELRAVLRAPNSPINLAAPPSPHKQSVTWVWAAMCPINKILPVLKVGPRTQDMAHDLLHDLALRLRPDSAPVFLSDGLMEYFYAITAHFGPGLPTVTPAASPATPAFFWKNNPDILYAQLRKHRVRRRLTRIETVAMIGFLPDIQKRLRLHGLSGKIQTALVERINNTMRADLAALARKAQALAHSPLHLQQLLLSWLAYYHLTRPHSSLRLPKSKQPIPNLRDRTPASA